MNSIAKNNNKLPLIALCLGYFMVILDVTIVNVALPSIQKGLSTSLSGLQWVVDGYTLTFACFLLASGCLGDRLGSKNIFIIGLLFFVLTSIACATAPHIGLLVFYRLLQGISAALVVPTSLSLIKSSYQSKQEQSKAIGIWASIGGMAAFSGPILGSIFTAWAGWPAVFIINVPIGLLGIFLTMKYVVNPPRNICEGGFDLPAQFSIIISIAALAFSLIEAGRYGWFSLPVVSSFLLFLITLVVFIAIEKRAVLPMLPLTLFQSQNFSASLVIGMILNIGFYGELFVLPLYFQQIAGYSILMTGLAILPQPGLAAIASYMGGKMASTSGPKLPMAIGLMIGCIGFFSLFIVLAVINHNTLSYWHFILPLAAIGFGTAFTMPAATIVIMHSVSNAQAGIASAAFNASRQVGSLLGVAIFGTILTMITPFMSGMRVTLAIGGLVFLAAFIITLLKLQK